MHRLGATLIVWLIFGSQAAQAASCAGLELHAHRGAATEPENSVEAVRKAMAMPYGGVEVDLRRLSDGSWVLHHDAVLGRVVSYQNGGKPALYAPENLTSDQWARATLRNRSGAPTDMPPPRLDATLAVAHARASPKRRLHMEIKSKASCRELASLNDAVAGVMPTRSWMYSAFNQSALDCLRQVDDQVYLGLLIGPENESIQVKGVSLAGVAKALGGAGNPAVARNLEKLSGMTNRNLLTPQGMSVVARKLRAPAGVHVDVATYQRYPDVMVAARRAGLTVMTYSTVHDGAHRDALKQLRAKGVAMPDAAIVDSSPQMFCQGLR